MAVTKYAFFVEGQSEAIFIRELLLRMHCHSDIEIECTDLYFNRTARKIPAFTTPDPQKYFSIIVAGSDESVLGAIKERESNLILNDFQLIFGIRDMYSREYIEGLADIRLFQVIDSRVTNHFLDRHANAISTMTHPEKIRFFFTIMEIEAWYLAFYPFLERVNSRLTPDFINTETGYDLKNIDPETTFFHPAVTLGKIYALVGMTYSKSYDDDMSIVNQLPYEMIDIISQSGKVNSFINFYNELLDIATS